MSKAVERILITGGTGFIGSTAARRLAELGHSVTVADVNAMSPLSQYILGSQVDAVDYRRCSVDSWVDVTSSVRAADPSVIVHIAAVANPPFLQANPHVAFRVNVEGTFNVLEAARQQGVRTVIYFSSIGALPSVQYEPIDANHPTILAKEGPGSGFYGASKLASEAFTLAYGSAYGIDVRVVRPSAVYGLGMNWPIYIKPMVECSVRGEAVQFASGASFPRDYTHVEDVASLVVALLRAPVDADRVFYAATGEPLVTAGALAEIVREVVPGADIEIADRLSPEDELEILYRGQISIANAREQLSWSPAYASIRDGVRQYADTYRAFLDSGVAARGTA